MEITEKIIVSFWRKINKNKSRIFYNNKRCWEWTAYLNKDGYGKFGVGYIVVLAHRFSYELEYGIFDNSLFVLHHCDNPSCVNPEHLFLGTNKDNADDKVYKNRQSRLMGEKSGRSKLTEKQVLKIRELYNSGKFKQSEISKIFNVPDSTVWSIVHNIIWKHLK